MTHIARLAVVDGAGRRSSVWRFWTGNTSPSDELYVMPRSANGFKASFHHDGWCQVGPTLKLREEIRRGDRHAFDRWHNSTEIAPGVRVPFSLTFFPTELGEYSKNLKSDVIQVPAPTDPDSYLKLVVCLLASGKPDEEDWGVGNLVATLDFKELGCVALVAFCGTGATEILAEAKAGAQSPGQTWELPRHLTGDDRVAYVFPHSENDSREVLELDLTGLEISARPRLADEFDGKVREWSELSDYIPNLEDTPVVCAVLVVPRWPADPELFIDQRSRCSHEHLAADVSALVAAARGSNVSGDPRWDRLPGGALITGIAMNPEHFSSDADQTVG